MSDSVQPHRWQPTRLPRPWDSPGKYTGVGCHFLLQCMKVKSENEVAQSCLTLSNPMDCSLPDSPSIEFSRQEYWSGVPLGFNLYVLYAMARLGFLVGSDSKESACNVGDLGLISGLGRSPGGGHSNPLQYSCLENPHGQRSLVGCSPGVAKSRTQLSD